MWPCFKIHVLSLLLCMSYLVPCQAGKKIFCYYSSFAQTRNGVGNFLPEDINPHLCTHIIYAFVDITDDGKGLKPFNRNDQGPNGLYSRTLALKEKNPNLKVLLAVGGWQIGSKPFIPMISNEYNRRTWIKNVVNYLRTHGFDGFDVDWEFPATRGSPPEDKYRFTLLMKGLYEAFSREAQETGNDKLILTMATASGTYYIDQSYEPEKIINYIDFMLLMTYNYHGQWEKVTGHHSGLYRHSNDPKTGEKAQLYQEWSIDYWLDVGISKDKLIVGLPTYGMSFTLQNPSQHGLHAPASGGGRIGDYTRETGILAYYEICLNMQKKGWESEWIDDQAVPYTYGGDQWAGYENKDSIAIKSKNILSRGLAGAFVWSVEMDDFDGVCGDGEYPLLTTIVDIIGDGSRSSSAASHNKPEPELTYEVERKTTPTWKKSQRKLRFKKMKRKQAWRKVTVETTTSPPTTTTEEYEDYDTSSQGNILKVGPWKRPVWRKDGTRVVTEKVAKQTKKTWMKKGKRRNSNAIADVPTYTPDYDESKENDEEEPEDWETNSWWPSPTEKSWTESWTEPETTTVTVVTPPNAAASTRDDCKILGVGTFADPWSCEHFIICLPGNWQDLPPHRMACPAGTRFDSYLKICNYSDEVPCNH